MSKRAAMHCFICLRPRCDRAVYLAHGNGGAYSTAPAHSRCVEAAGEVVQSWNEDPGWYVNGDLPKLREVKQHPSTDQIDFHILLHRLVARCGATSVAEMLGLGVGDVQRWAKRKPMSKMRLPDTARCAVLVPLIRCELRARSID